MGIPPDRTVEIDESAFDALARSVASADHLKSALPAVYHIAHAGGPTAATACLPRLEPIIRHAPLQALGPVALLAGAMVELGGDPAAFPPAVLDRVGELLDLAPAAPTRADGEPDDGDDNEKELPEAFYECERAIAAALSVSADLRRTLPQKASLLGKIHRYAERYGFLGKMLQVLDDEPLLIVHPGTQRAWRARFGGIADNFQLHTLLRAALAGEGPDRIAGKPPTREVVAVASDGRSASKGLAAESDWQLVNWQAIRPDGSIAGQRDTTYWIWNEGFPAEVSPFEGTRLIAIGPSTIHRSWNAQRVFNGMRGWLEVIGPLFADDTRSLLARIHAANATPDGGA